MRDAPNNWFTVNDIAKGCSQCRKYGHILTFGQKSGWAERCCGMTNGNELSNYCLARRPIVALRPKTIGALSRRCSGSCAPGVRGAIFPQNWGIGTEPLCASRAGARKAFGNISRQHCRVTLTWSNCLLTRPSFVPTSIPQVPKKSRRSGNRSLARRADDQTACRGRFLGQSAAGDSFCGADLGYRTSRGADQGSVCRVHCGRQGIRLGRLRRNNL